MRFPWIRGLPLAVSLLTAGARAAGVPATSVEEIVVTAERRLFGAADSATEGVAPSEQLEIRPVLRTGELLEVVPGLIVTQHSGDARRTSTSCAASISITAQTSRRAWMACPSTCRRTRMGRATAI